MDNLAHTLAGAALARAGLHRSSGLATATLMIAANIPDVDVIGLAFGENLAWRRGWTHGPLGFVLLPLLLAWTMLGYDRWQARRGRRPADRLPVRAGVLFLLGLLGFASHIGMDWLNTYGVRCLMPFVDRWFYGDTLFIIDVWLWTILTVGCLWSGRRWRRTLPRAGAPAIGALVIASLYTTAMGWAGRAAERMGGEAAQARGWQVRQVVASPVPVNPFRREISIATGDAYGFGEVRFLFDPKVSLEPGLVPRGMNDPAVARAAAQSEEMADFLVWARMPYARVERTPGSAAVTLRDARYGSGIGGRDPFVVTARVAE